MGLFQEAETLTVPVDDDEIPTHVTVTVVAHIELDNPNNKSAAALADTVKQRFAPIPEAVFHVSASRPATFEEKLAHQAVGNPFGTPPMVNGHELERIKRYDGEPCWRIGYLQDITDKLSPAELEEWKDRKSGDFPNGLIHDETCFQCHGTGVQKTDVTIGYRCRGCSLEFVGNWPITEFHRSWCLAEYYPMISLEIVHEWAVEHDEDGHRFDIPGCPRCAENRMKERAGRLVESSATRQDRK